MKFLGNFLAIAGLTGAMVCGPAFARDATPAERVRFTAMEYDWVDAEATQNVLRVNRILASDFVHVAWNGHVNDKKRALYRAGHAKPYGNQHLRDIGVRMFKDDMAIVSGVNQVDGAQGGAVQLRFTDVFVQREGSWQAVSAQETLISAD